MSPDQRLSRTGRLCCTRGTDFCESRRMHQRGRVGSLSSPSAPPPKPSPSPLQDAAHCFGVSLRPGPPSSFSGSMSSACVISPGSPSGPPPAAASLAASGSRPGPWPSLQLLENSLVRRHAGRAGEMGQEEQRVSCIAGKPAGPHLHGPPSQSPDLLS